MSKHHKDYGPVLYARIVMHLKEAKEPQTVSAVAREVLGENYTPTARNRVLRILNNLTQAGQVARDTEPTTHKHINRYIFTYIEL